MKKLTKGVRNKILKKVWAMKVGEDPKHRISIPYQIITELEAHDIKPTNELVIDLVHNIRKLQLKSKNK